MIQKYDYIVKVIIVGESTVGKTSILRRYTQNTFNDEKCPTIGVDFIAKSINTPKHKIQLQLWDTSGQEVYRSMTSGYFKGAIGALFVFDLKKEDTFNKLNSWLEDVKELAHQDCVLTLIANKLDLIETQENKEQIEKNDEINSDTSKEQVNEFINDAQNLRTNAQKFAKENSMLYFEISAKTGQNVQNAFDALVGAIEKNLDDGLYDIASTPDTIDFQNDHAHTSSCC